MAADACVQMPPKGSGNRKFGGSGRRKAGHADKKGVRGRGQDGRGHRGHDGQYPQPKAAKVDWDKHCEEHFELAEGTALVVDPDDESAPAPNAPPDSPAAAAHARSRSQRKGAGRRTIRLGWDD